MLLWLNEDNIIKAWNEVISIDDAQNYISKNGCIWHDGTFPKVSNKEGYEVVYFYDGREIKWEYVEISKPVTPQPTQLDRIESMVAKSQEQIAQEARDAYTLELIEGGVIA